jgi:hypothetical protein
VRNRLRPDVCGIDYGGRYAYRETAAYKRRTRLAALEAVVGKLAAVYTVETDQAALIALVAEAMTLNPKG